VLEAADRNATVEVARPVKPGPGAIERAICAIAALAMTALTLAALVILPARMGAAVPASTMAASRGIETAQSSAGPPAVSYPADTTVR